MQSTEEIQQKESNQSVIIGNTTSRKRDDVYKNAEFTLNSQAKIHTCFCEEDYDLFEADVETSKLLRPFEKKKQYALHILYEYAMDKYNFENDNRWLMLFNIVSAMRKKSKDFYIDTHIVVNIGRSEKNKFISFLQTEWDNTWADYQSYNDEGQIVFCDLIKGRRTDNKTIINFNNIIDLSFEFLSWADVIIATIKTPDIDFQISFSGLNSILEPIIYGESEGNNE